MVSTKSVFLGSPFSVSQYKFRPWAVSKCSPMLRSWVLQVGYGTVGYCMDTVWTLQTMEGCIPKARTPNTGYYPKEGMESLLKGHTGVGLSTPTGTHWDTGTLGYWDTGIYIIRKLIINTRIIGKSVTDLRTQLKDIVSDI